MKYYDINYSIGMQNLTLPDHLHYLVHFVQAAKRLPESSYDVIIVNRENRCFTLYYVLFHIIRH